MLVKFFDTGKGSARSAFQYLLNKERVRNGTAVLLSGSPESIRAVHCTRLGYYRFLKKNTLQIAI